MIDTTRLAEYPPFICRVLARITTKTSGKRTVVPLSSVDIAARSSLSAKKVVWISSQPTWDKVVIGDAVAFLKGCNLLNAPVWRLRWFLVRNHGKERSLQHLDQLPREDRRRVCKTYNELAPLWIERLKNL